MQRQCNVTRFKNLAIPTPPEVAFVSISWYSLMNRRRVFLFMYFWCKHRILCYMLLILLRIIFIKKIVVYTLYSTGQSLKTVPCPNRPNILYNYYVVYYNTKRNNYYGETFLWCVVMSDVI